MAEQEKPAHPPLKPGEAWELIGQLGPKPEKRDPTPHTEDSERR